MALCLSMNGSMNQISHKLREKENSRMEERRRSILYLILDYLKRCELMESYNTLFSEAQLSPTIQICDNIDLEIILMEYESYYNIKFNKHPTLWKIVDAKSCTNTTPNKKKSKLTKSDTCKEKVTQQINSTFEDDINLGLTVTPLSINENENKNEQLIRDPRDILPMKSKILNCIEKLYPASSELRKIAEDISLEIVSNDLNIHWNDVIGLKDCKQTIMEAVVYPLKYPNFFSEKFSPWKGILLYGPSGTGKTMLAKAAATECKCTFINMTASSLVSKWRGDSEKYIRVLFDIAYNQSPTIIFIDEIDWISTTTENSLSEPARRFRAELLTRLDGLISPKDSHVMLLATTNAPWNIDPALLRRLEKPIYVPLPSQSSRIELFSLYLSPNLLTKEMIQHLIKQTDQYSSAEIIMICKKAWMIQSTPLWEALEKREVSLTNLTFQIKEKNALYKALEESKPIPKNMNVYMKWASYGSPVSGNNCLSISNTKPSYY